MRQASIGRRAFSSTGPERPRAAVSLGDRSKPASGPGRRAAIDAPRHPSPHHPSALRAARPPTTKNLVLLSKNIAPAASPLHSPLTPPL